MIEENDLRLLVEWIHEQYGKEMKHTSGIMCKIVGHSGTCGKHDRFMGFIGKTQEGNYIRCYREIPSTIYVRTIRVRLTGEPYKENPAFYRNHALNVYPEERTKS